MYQTRVGEIMRYIQRMRLWLKRMTVVDEYPTKLPGRWMNVGKGRVDAVVADPAYTPKKSASTGRIRDDMHRLLLNETS